MQTNNLNSFYPLRHRSFLFLGLSYFLVFFHVSLFYIYPLILDDMGSESHVIGWIMGIFSIAAVLSRPLMGRIAAGKGEYRLMSAGLIVILVASMGYNLIHRVGPLMLVTRVIHGIGFSAYIAGSFSLVAKTFPREKRSEAYGVVGAAIMGATAIGPLTGEYLAGRYGFNSLYFIASGVIFLAWTAILKAEKRSEHLCDFEESETAHTHILRERSFIFLLCSSFIFAQCQATVFNFLALTAAQKGITGGEFFFTSFFIAIPVLLGMGRIIDRHGKIFFLRLAYPLFSFGILLIPIFFQAHHYYFVLPAILFGVGMGLLFPVHNALAAGYGEKDEKPAVMSIFTAVYDTGFITGAVISGLIARWTNLDMLFYSMGILGLAGFLIAVVSPIKES